MLGSTVRESYENQSRGHITKVSRASRRGIGYCANFVCATGIRGDDMTKKKYGGFSDEERAAMKERAQELAVGDTKGESAILTKIAEMPEPDQTMAKRIHEIIRDNAPAFSPRIWYGMPAYADRDGKVVCFFQSAHRFKSRYATLGFNDAARLDEGNMWPTSFALKKLTTTEEAKIAALVKKAVR
jgi:uncharacterized protein YdhG (YjbR/CyaY superfamily)